VVESTEFYPFGRARHEYKNGFVADYQYTGKELDKETGLMYYEARYMDAVTGRFVSVDPLAVAPLTGSLLNPQLIHAYAYAGNNPIYYLDDDGRSATLAGAVLGGVAGATFKAHQIYKLKKDNHALYEQKYAKTGSVAKSIAWAGAKGAIKGAAAGLIIDTGGAAAGAGALAYYAQTVLASSAVGAGVGQLLEGKDASVKGFIKDFAFGLAGGSIAGGVFGSSPSDLVGNTASEIRNGVIAEGLGLLDLGWDADADGGKIQDTFRDLNADWEPAVFGEERGVGSFIKVHQKEQRRQQEQDRVNQVAEGAIEN
jgi:RHS repeat-associated protein